MRRIAERGIPVMVPADAGTSFPAFDIGLVLRHHCAPEDGVFSCAELLHLVGWVPAGDNAICQVNVAKYPENLHIHGNFL